MPCLETAQEVDSEARERNLQGEEKNLSMAQSNSNEHVAKSLDYESQAKDSPEVITDRLATPRKDARKKRRPTLPPAVQKILAGTNSYHPPYEKTYCEAAEGNCSAPRLRKG